MNYFHKCFRGFSSRKLKKLLNEMPKNTTHIEAKQKQFIKIREKSQQYSPGIVNLQILGNGSKGSPASVYLFSEQARYLFNCGEGTQRLAHEHKSKLTRLEHIFLTRKTWNRFGGISGLCLTLQEVGVPVLTLHGPSGIDEIFQATSKFVVLRNLKVSAPKCESKNFYEDSVLKLEYVPLYKNNAIVKESEFDQVVMTDNTDYYGYEEKNDNLNDQEMKQCENGENTDEINVDIHQTPHVENHVMAYICKLKSRPGALDLEKCVDKGVPAGPLLGQLKNGNDVTLDNGTIVRSNDVRRPACPGPVFLFIDIPDETYIEALTNCTEFKCHQRTAKSDDDVATCVIHFTSEKIVQNEKYQEFIDSFSPSTKHLYVNDRNKYSGYAASHRIQFQLNELNSNIFPLLKEEYPRMELDSNRKDLGTMSILHLRPNKGLDRNLETNLIPENVLEEMYNTPNLKEILAEFKMNVEEKIRNNNIEIREKLFPKIVFFGTGSCIPNKTRNVSAILIHVNEDSCILMDCGEGTYGQLCRFYGPSNVSNILKKLKMIYISHLHADHHLGLIEILHQRNDLGCEKLVLLAPHQIRAWLSFYNYGISEILNSFDLYGNYEFTSWSTINRKFDIIDRVGISNIETCLVKHCPHSFGISIEMENNMKDHVWNEDLLKLTYSGDCTPSENLVEIGKNSSILIHEATMEDDLIDEAKIKMHSTISQAIDVGKRMNAKYTILTHFSQRYAKIPLMNMDKINNVAIAFDNMEVTLNDLPALSHMYEPLKVMFSEHFELIKQKNIKRKYQQERRMDNKILRTDNGDGLSELKN